MKKFAVYIRVSTQRQGASGLGLESQRKICDDFIVAKDGEKVAEYKDVESGTHRDRKGLWQAIEYCKKNDCSLVIAKLDRLARDVEFTFKVINTGIDIHFTDMPVVNSMILGVFAAVAQYEREMVSTRTKQALAAKKARGEKLGGASGKWIEAYNSKTKEQKEKEGMARGKTRTTHYLQKRDTQVFLKVLSNVFPTACIGDDATQWDWKNINTKGDNKDKILRLMQDYRDMDESGMLFKKWDFHIEPTTLQIRLCAYILNVRRSIHKHCKANNVVDSEPAPNN